MSETISEILEVLRYVAERYEPGMSRGRVEVLRLESVRHVALRRGIQESTVTDKYRRRLRPAIDGTQRFDEALYGWLDSRTSTLHLALEQNAGDSGDSVRINEFFIIDPLREQISEDLAAQCEEAADREDGTGTEGGQKLRLISYFERDPAIRARATEIHGTTCKACGFNFEDAYGVHGKNYIEVHHIVPVSTLAEPSVINPKDHMTVLCSNCHRMVHRKRNAPLSIEELKKIVRPRPR